ncbi:MAG TPA: AAA family ATPase [Vicinamibacterales bacterium]|nr:AAA family ATPase [Vicinamibacterales bacterium]
MAIPPPLRIELLGGFRLFVDGRSLARPPSARQQQLIAFLVLHARSAPIQRQRVGGSLWPESGDGQALTNLRRELHHLREGWPMLDALIDAGSRTLAWQREAGAIVDLVAFEAAADRGLQGHRASLQEAARLYQGDLLPECAGEWIEPDRERLRQRAREVLARLVDLLEHDRAFGDAIGHAQQLLRLDPVDEQAWCALMRCHARRGERATALHLYQQCAAVLKKELGIQPSAATRITYREILDLDAAESITPAPPRTAIYPLVGRQSEWQALLDAWRTAAAGRTRLFLIRGEAGIGKTRLAEELVDWSGVNGITSVITRCYAGEGRLAYAPIAAWLKSDALRPALMRLDPSWVTDVARLRPELLATRPEVPAPDRGLESWQRLRFFEALSQAFRSAAPLVLVVDDLQWADGDTIDWIQYFVRSASDTRCLVVGTVRAEEEQDNLPLGRLLAHLERDNLLTTITLGPLDRTATLHLAAEVAEHPLDETTQARTFQETEGHPLFIVERGRMELATQPDPSGGTALPQVQAVVAARLALLSEDARAVAEVAAAVGRDFQFDILARASDLEEDTLVRALDELWRRHIVRVQADERWDFSHDRIREITYSGIAPARRRLIHRRIAQGMELLFANRLDDVSASIAVHLDRGGQPARAVPFLERAAAVATRVSANEEAIRCLTHALSLVQMLPAGRDRDEQELALRSSLSIALNSGRGYAAPEVEQNLARVFTLSLADGRGQVPVRWLWVTFTLRFMLGDLKGTREASEQALAYSLSDRSCRCEAHHAMGGTLLSLGELDASRHHFAAALAAYDEAHPQRSALGSDLGVFAHAWSAHTLWLLGDESAAVARAEQGVALARRLDHKYSETLALAYAALLHQMRLDTERVLACAEAVVALCERYGFAYYGDWANALIGWARGQERPAEGVEIIESALERLDRNRAQARRPYYLSLLAETYRRCGNRDRAASTLDAAITMALERDDVWWLPALYLQKSELEPAPKREATLRRGLVLARTQNSRALEQRILGSTIAHSI